MNFLRVAEQIRARNVVVNADLGTAQRLKYSSA